MLLSNSSTEDRETLNLYGKGPFEFAVLINRKPTKSCVPPDAADQPVRRRAASEIVFLGEACRIGGYCYSDINARITEAKGGVLDDSKSALNGLAFLQ